ncbi:MAG: glutamate synthase subunit alpha, partial [Spirochaetales bacterium]
MDKAKGLYDAHYEHDSCGVGFVVNVNGFREHGIVEDGITILCNLEHRGAVGGDLKTGDGAGMLLAIPHEFFTSILPFTLPEPGSYGAGMFFFPEDGKKAAEARSFTEVLVKERGAEFLGWREVPVEPQCLGELARENMPGIWQAFIKVPGKTSDTLERFLYLLRKCLESGAAERGWDMLSYYVSSLSCATIVYKGMFVAPQFPTFFPDLKHPEFKSPFSLVHQRYSTNTFPSWPLAQPFRRMAHNGEINTIRRNVNNMNARESHIASGLFGEDIKKLLPIVNPHLSDSAIFDNVFELLSLGGRSLEHSMVMMVPEAFGSKFHISEDKRAFFEYHAAIMEPWDGPAAIAFADGRKIGAILDRNGLRPSRYVITKSGRVVLASEVGVLDIDPADVREKGRLAPGKMLLVDMAEGRVIKDNEIKSRVSRRKPYRRWLEANRIEAKGLFQEPGPVSSNLEDLINRQVAFGYTAEDIKSIILPMVRNAQEPLGSMGNDEAVSVLSDRPQLLYNYFRQLFAQVTNPPIDPYRESLVMSLMSFIGRERNLLDETPEHCRQLKLHHPVLTNDDIDRLKISEIPGFTVCSLSILYRPSEHNMETALRNLCVTAEEKINEGHSLI